MVHRKSAAGVATALAGLMLLAACGNDSAGSSSASGDANSVSGKKFVLMVGVKGDPFYVSMQCGAESPASGSSTSRSTRRTTPHSA